MVNEARKQKNRHASRTREAVISENSAAAGKEKEERYFAEALLQLSKCRTGAMAKTSWCVCEWVTWRSRRRRNPTVRIWRVISDTQVHVWVSGQNRAEITASTPCLASAGERTYFLTRNVTPKKKDCGGESVCTAQCVWRSGRTGKQKYRQILCEWRRQEKLTNCDAAKNALLRSCGHWIQCLPRHDLFRHPSIPCWPHNLWSLDNEKCKHVKTGASIFCLALRRCGQTGKKGQKDRSSPNHQWRPMGCLSAKKLAMRPSSIVQVYPSEKPMCKDWIDERDGLLAWSATTTRATSDRIFLRNQMRSWKKRSQELKALAHVGF